MRKSVDQPFSEANLDEVMTHEAIIDQEKQSPQRSGFPSGRSSFVGVHALACGVYVCVRAHAYACTGASLRALSSSIMCALACVGVNLRLPLDLVCNQGVVICVCALDQLYVGELAGTLCRRSCNFSDLEGTTSVACKRRIFPKPPKP